MNQNKNKVDKSSLTDLILFLFNIAKPRYLQNKVPDSLVSTQFVNSLGLFSSAQTAYHSPTFYTHTDLKFSVPSWSCFMLAA